MAAVIKGWLDDSKSDTTWIVGGYIGAWHRWEFFDGEWPRTLEKHDVPYFHMREWANPRGVYGKWHPPREHRDEVAGFMSDLARVISDSRLVGICSIVRRSHLERFNADHGLDLQEHPLCVYGCMLMAARYLENTPLELIFDHLEKVRSKLDLAEAYAEADRNNAEDLEWVTPHPLGKKLTFREVPAMQAADFFIAEFRKQHEKLGDWFDLIERPEDPDASWKDQQGWAQDRYGSPIGNPRKSAIALVEGNEFYPLIWDYPTLCKAHEIRGGVWI